MASWRAEKMAFRNGSRVRPGAEIVCDDDPGSAFVPLDDDAKAARELAQEMAAKREAERNAPPKPPVIEIPDDWLDMRPEQVVNLARKLGASGRCNFNQAVSHIESVLRERGQLPPLEPASKPVEE